MKYATKQIFQIPSKMKFCKCRNWYKKSQNELCIYKIRTRKHFQPKLPHLASSSFQSSRLRRVNFDLRVFFTGFAKSQFCAIFHRILLLHIGSCFVLGKWVDGTKFRYKRKSQRHLWSALGGPEIFAILFFYFFRPWMAVCNIRIS